MDGVKILLVTEEPFRENSFGFGRTITNLFKSYPIDLLSFYLPNGDFTHKDYVHKHKVFCFNNLLLKVTAPRWYAPILNKWLFPLNHSYLVIRKNKKNLAKLKKENFDIIVIVPMNYTTLLEGYLTAKRLSKPYVVYLMDDSLRDNSFHFWCTTTAMHKKIMQKAAGWMMISEYLNDVLAQRYSHKSSSVLIVHNPIDEKSIQDIRPSNNEVFTVGYAGSIHGFHADALIKVAIAVSELKRQGLSIRLNIYCQQYAWSTYEKFLNIPGVFYCGVVAYDSLFAELSKLDLLLCTTSFDLVYKHLVETSVFTKLTDYMASAVPVLSYGPEYSANSKYLSKNKVGIVYSDSRIECLVEYFQKMIPFIRENHVLIVQRQLDFLRQQYTMPIVREKTYTFLNKVAKAR